MVNSIDRDQEPVEALEQALGQVLKGYRQMLDVVEAVTNDEDLGTQVQKESEREMAKLREGASQIISWAEER